LWMPLRYIQMSQHGITAIYRCHNQTYKCHNVQYFWYFLTTAMLSNPVGRNFRFTFCSSVDKDGPWSGFVGTYITHRHGEDVTAIWCVHWWWKLSGLDAWLCMFTNCMTTRVVHRLVINSCSMSQDSQFDKLATQASILSKFVKSKE